MIRSKRLSGFSVNEFLTNSGFERNGKHGRYCKNGMSDQYAFMAVYGNASNMHVQIRIPGESLPLLQCLQITAANWESKLLKTIQTFEKVVESIKRCNRCDRPMYPVFTTNHTIKLVCHGTLDKQCPAIPLELPRDLHAKLLVLCDPNKSRHHHVVPTLI